MIIHQYEKDLKSPYGSKNQGILYPILEINSILDNTPIQETNRIQGIGTATGYLKTTRTATRLTFGAGNIENAYFDYKAEYISKVEYDNNFASNTNSINEALTVHYYDLSTFKKLKDIQAIEEDIQTVEESIQIVEESIQILEQSFLPINGSKPMEGDLDLGVHQLSKLDTKEVFTASVRSADFTLGHPTRRGKLHPTDYLGRALVDASDDSSTILSVNHGLDWDNTHIGGKVYLKNVENSPANASLLLMDDNGQVIKSTTVDKIDVLISRITALEARPLSGIPIGMIAIWGKPAPFPAGWVEYVELRGRMPVGFDSTHLEFDTIGKQAGIKNKTLSILEIPKHTHFYNDTYFSEHWGTLPLPYGVGSAGGADNDNFGYEMQRTSGPAGGPVVGAIGLSTPFSLLNPYRVVRFIEYKGISTDTQVPTAPINLVASNITSNGFTLNWSASTDNVAVVGYNVYRNGVSEATLGNVLTYSTNDLGSNTFYELTIKARDAEGNLSVGSNHVNITTLILTADTTAPTAPSYITSNISGNIISVSWDDEATDNMGIDHYELWRKSGNSNFQKIYTTINNQVFSYNDAVPFIAATYSYIVRAVDTAGNVSPFSGQTSIDMLCFDVESLVTMASGQSKKLKNVAIGDKLQSLHFPNEIDESNGDYMQWQGKLNEGVKTEVTVVNKRTAFASEYYEISTQDGAIMKVTGEHPLLVTQDGENVQWLKTKDIQESMSLIDKNGKAKPIQSIVIKEETLEVATLDVEDVDNYVIAGIVAHNKTRPITPSITDEFGNLVQN